MARFGKDSELGYKNIPGHTIGNRVPLVNAFPDCKVVFNKGYHYVSGFIGFPSGHWVYFCSSDDRMNPVNYYARTAKNEKDYTGGSNHFTKTNDKKELIELIKYLSTRFG